MGPMGRMGRMGPMRRMSRMSRMSRVSCVDGLSPHPGALVLPPLELRRETAGLAVARVLQAEIFVNLQQPLLQSGVL